MLLFTVCPRAPQRQHSEWQLELLEDLHRVEAAEAFIERRGEHGIEYRISDPAAKSTTESRSFLWPRGWAPQRWLASISTSPSASELEEQLRALVAELDHRVKNALAR
jgi:two-component sensor histidine kinase